MNNPFSPAAETLIRHLLSAMAIAKRPQGDGSPGSTIPAILARNSSAYGLVREALRSTLIAHGLPASELLAAMDRKVGVARFDYFELIDLIEARKKVAAAEAHREQAARLFAVYQDWLATHPEGDCRGWLDEDLNRYPDGVRAEVNKLICLPI